MGIEDKFYPKNQNYLKIYDKSESKEEALNQLHRYMIDHGKIREKFRAVKYYADAYDFYAGKKTWPNYYDEIEPDGLYMQNDDGAWEFKVK